MMLRAVIRRAASKGSSPLFFGKSLQSSRVAASFPSLLTCSEIGTLLHRGNHAHSFHNLALSGNSGCSRSASSVSSTLQRWVRPFSSESGDTVEAVVPHMGESITDGTLANFLKKPGERVEADEAIAQIETDKVTIDIASPASGVIQEV